MFKITRNNSNSNIYKNTQITPVIVEKKGREVTKLAKDPLPSLVTKDTDIFKAAAELTPLQLREWFINYVSSESSESE